MFLLLTCICYASLVSTSLKIHHLELRKCNPFDLNVGFGVLEIL